ncbi:MAG: hypothetical protein FWD58_07450, partial [Firmicutes bacterium]|nr:hypothetical protein [Bacillota bacterium]
EKILAPSPHRAVPPCPYFPKCGGCTLQHVSYPRQLEFKRDNIVSTVRKIAGIELPLAEVAASDAEFRCRNKCSLPVKPGQCTSDAMVGRDVLIAPEERDLRHDEDIAPYDGVGNSRLSPSIKIGFFRRNSNDVVDIADCLMQNKSVRDLIAGFREWLSRGRGRWQSAAKPQKYAGGIFLAQAGSRTAARTGVRGQESDNNPSAIPNSSLLIPNSFRHLTLRSLGGIHTVTLVGTRKNPEELASFSNVLRRIYGENFAFYYNYNPVRTNVIYGQEFTFLAGKDEPVAVDGLKMRIHPAGFFQVNDFIRGELYAHIIKKAVASDAGYAIEAYAGAGVLAAKLAPYFKQVLAVEISPESIKAGEEIKELNGIGNLRFIQGDCAEELGKLFSQITNETKNEKRKTKNVGWDLEGEEKNIDSKNPSEIPHSSLLTPNSPSAIPHSSLLTPNSVLILDPPRQGLSSAVVETLVQSGSPAVIYVSCNPATFARDLSGLKAAYTVLDAAAFDMFPQTEHAELVVTLKRS